MLPIASEYSGEGINLRGLNEITISVSAAVTVAAQGARSTDTRDFIRFADERNTISRLLCSPFPIPDDAPSVEVSIKEADDAERLYHICLVNSP